MQCLHDVGELLQLVLVYGGCYQMSGLEDSSVDSGLTQSQRFNGLNFHVTNAKN